MRIISLNIWEGKLIDPLIQFLLREASATDAFCLQEATSSLKNSPEHPDIFARIAKALPGFQGFFEANQEEGDVEVGLATFIRKTEAVDKEGDFFVYRTRNALIGDDWSTKGRNAQFLEFSEDGREYALVNFHGLADSKDSETKREDSPERIEQAKRLKALLNALTGIKIVCGDFNLTKDSKSLTVIGEGMRNLINESGITSTRPDKYFPYPDKFCDYIFIDPLVKVKKFEVLQDEVSDHFPLVLEAE